MEQFSTFQNTVRLYVDYISLMLMLFKKCSIFEFHHESPSGHALVSKQIYHFSRSVGRQLFCYIKSILYDTRMLTYHEKFVSSVFICLGRQLKAELVVCIRWVPFKLKKDTHTTWKNM